MWFFFFNEKTMLQHTQEEKKQGPENYSNNDHKVQVDLDTHIKGKKPLRIQRILVQKINNMTIQLLVVSNTLSNYPLGMVLEIQSPLHLLLVIKILLVFKRHYTVKIKVNRWMLQKKKLSLCIRTKHESQLNFQRGRG